MIPFRSIRVLIRIQAYGGVSFYKERNMTTKQRAGIS
jgi:hypothetical protein